MAFIKFLSCLAFLTFVACYKPIQMHQQLCALDFHDCGSTAGALKSVSFNGTCNGGKAILLKGTTVSIDFSFSANADELELTSKVYGKIGELPFVKFPLDNPNACVSSGLTCPIKASVAQDYQPTLTILKAYPSVNVIVKWELQNKAGQDVFCALIPATITS
ncbi:unnamed protein product [Lymnaea stagnalis]|uniref:MD-2-related lipid-recognition domain-containing protein n=1 Tax=Lymnaea stagnalis TaxID=6523 RepID=A0AAV2I6H9_LYMST